MLLSWILSEYHFDVPCAIDAFLQEASQFRHHSHQTSLDVLEMDVLKKLKNGPFYGKLSSFFRGPLN